MKKFKKITACFLVLLLTISTLAGCLERIELNKIGMVSGLGIDLEEDGSYTVTAQTLKPTSLAGNNSALPVYSLQAKGDTIHEAFQRIDQLATTALFLAHLNVIVVNEALAESGLSPVLNFALRHNDVRPDINILVAKDTTASDVLNVLITLDIPPAGELDIYTNMIHTHTARLVTYHLYEVVDMVNTNTINVVLNAVSIHYEDEDKKKDAGNVKNVQTITPNAQLRIEHLAVFKEDQIQGFLNNSQAQLYNMALGDHKRYSLQTRIEEEYYVSAEVTSTKSKIETDLNNNQATLNIELVARIVENAYPIDLTTQDNLDVMADYLQQQVEKDFTDFITYVQQELGTDIFGIGGKAYYQEHHTWSEVKGYWEELFPELEITINLDLKIDSVGEIGNVTL